MTSLEMLNQGIATNATNMCCPPSAPLPPSEEVISIGMLSEILEGAIQKAGEFLGLDQVQIDYIQSRVLEAIGDNAGALRNAIEALEGFLEGLPATDRGYVENVQNELIEVVYEQIRIMDRANAEEQERAENTDAVDGKNKKSMNFFELLASMLGELLGNKAADMIESLNDFKNAGGIKDDEGNLLTEEEINNLSDKEHARLMTKSSQEFGIAQAEFSADSQEYNMVSSLVNTVLKGIGESMSTLARRQ